MRFSPYERLKQSAAGESVAMQTDATSHNIFTPTMLGVVGTCCVVHANERNNCQPCWRFSIEAMHSGTVILKKIAMRMHRRFHEADIVGTTLKRYALPVTEQWKCWELLRQSLTGFKLYATQLLHMLCYPKKVLLLKSVVESKPKLIPKCLPENANSMNLLKASSDLEKQHVQPSRTINVFVPENNVMQQSNNSLISSWLLASGMRIITFLFPLGSYDIFCSWHKSDKSIQYTQNYFEMVHVTCQLDILSFHRLSEL